MIFIIGGSYQGKRDFALKEYHLQESDVFICTDAEAAIDWSKPVIANIERFALGCVRRGEEPRDFWKAQREQLQDKILISDDISCGVVPIDAEIRAWQEATGRANNYRAGEADRVWRVFCGIGQVIK